MSASQRNAGASAVFHVTRLENGLRVVTVPMPHRTSVSLGFWVGVGSRFEPTPLNGASHFIEHLLFKGTRRRSAKEISQAVEGVGGYLNAFTTEEHTCFYSKAKHDRLPVLMDVLADMYHHSRFDPVDVDKERAVIKEELAMYLDQPAQRVQELLNAAMWPNHALGRPLTGTNRSLDALGRRELLGFHHASYLASNTILAAAGNVSHREHLHLARKICPRFRVGDLRPFEPWQATQSKPVLRLYTKAVEQTQLACGIRVCRRHDLRRYPLRLLNTVLGENMSSRLFQIIREDRGLAYSIYSNLGLFEDTGVLTISAGLDTDNLPRVMRIIVRELKRLREEPLSRKELQRAKDYLIGQMELGVEGTENLMMWVGEQLLSYGRIFSPSTVKSRIRAVTASEVRRVADDFFRPEALTLALVSPLKRPRSIEKILAF